MNKKWFAVIATMALSVSAVFALIGLMGQTNASPSHPTFTPSENRRIVSETLTAPVVTAVNPGVALNDVDTDIVIQGSGFTATLSGTVVLTAPTVFLGNEALPNVIWANTTTMSATVPWGLTPDVYSMTVINPDGISATLSSAFTVTQGIGVFNTGGPYGGIAVQLALNPHISSTVYASMFGAGLFISEDAAGTWEPIHNHDWPIHLDVDAQDPNLLYFGADSNDLYRSRDNGATWERISGSFNTTYGCFRTYPVAHPDETDHVYFAMGSCAGISLELGEGGVFSSTNAGETWITRTNSLSDTDVQSLAIDPNDPGNLLAGTLEGNLFTSNNSGADWSFSTQLTGTVTRLYFNPHVSELEAWAITASQAEGRGYLYRSTNLTDWTVMDVHVPPGGGSAQAQMAFLPNSVWLAAGSIYSSTDGGANWNALAGPVESTSAIAISPDDPQTIYAGTDFGVVVSYDGGVNWQEMYEGLAAMVPSAIVVSADDPATVYVKTWQSLFASQDGGNSWRDLHYGSGGFPGGNLFAADSFSSTRLYLTASCEDQFCIDISPNAGTSWHLVTSTLPSTTTYAGWSCDSFAIAPSPHTPGRILVGASLAPPGYGFDFTGVFYRSDDYGASWESIEPTQPISQITEIAHDAFDPNLVYAAASASGLWRSRDGGYTWENVQVGTMEPPIGVSSIAVHPDVTGTIYVRAGSLVTPNWPSELWVYEDAGETWRSLNDAEISVDLLVAPPLSGQPFYSLYTGCGDGLCRSLDEGGTWSIIEGIPRPEILVGASDGDRSLIYLGIPGGLPTSVGRQTTRALDAIPGRGSLLGGGVYRLTTLLPTDWVYLPLVLNGYAP